MSEMSGAITWRAPEFEHRPKDLPWFWASIAVAAILVGFAMWQKNFPFGFFIIVAEILVMVWGGREPRTIAFALGEKGLTIDGEKFYAVGDIENFSVDETGTTPALVVRLRRKFQPLMRVLVPGERLPEVTQALESMVAKIEYEPTLTDIVERFLGF